MTRSACGSPKTMMPYSPFPDRNASSHRLAGAVSWMLCRGVGIADQPSASARIASTLVFWSLQVWYAHAGRTVLSQKPGPLSGDPPRPARTPSGPPTCDECLERDGAARPERTARLDRRTCGGAGDGHAEA